MALGTTAPEPRDGRERLPADECALLARLDRVDALDRRRRAAGALSGALLDELLVELRALVRDAETFAAAGAGGAGGAGARPGAGGAPGGDPREEVVARPARRLQGT